MACTKTLKRFLRAAAAAVVQWTDDIHRTPNRSRSSPQNQPQRAYSPPPWIPPYFSRKYVRKQGPSESPQKKTRSLSTDRASPSPV